jgi:transposase-like protein
MIENASSAQRAAKVALWRERIAEQERSGRSVRQFCRDRGFSEHSLYAWRKRLRSATPVRFALVEPANVPLEDSAGPKIELLLAGGERLRIHSGVDAATLRTVLDALRA